MNPFEPVAAAARSRACAWWLGAALALAPPAARAQERPLSLDEALELAGERNPELGAAREQAQAEALRAEAVRGMTWPRVQLGSGWSRSDNPSMVFAQKLNAGRFSQDDFQIERLNRPDALSHLSTVLSVEAPLDVFGKVKTAALAQSAVGDASAAGARQAAQDVRLHVIEAYRQAALAQRAVEVTTRAVEGARAREADVEARVGEGAALSADLLRARARRRQREADLAGARGQARVTRAQLARLLGLEASTELRLTDATPAPAPPEGDVTTWTQSGLARRPALEAARHGRDAAESARRAEQRTLLPDLAVWGQIQDDRNHLGSNQTGAFGAMLRWSVFDRSRARREAAAAAQARAAERQAQAALDQVRLEVEAAWQRARTARERYAAAAGGAEEGREALRVVQERRQAGLATLTDELETEAAALAAELEELRAATEAALADAALKHAAGVL
jgi:outer membrane protein TolC